MTGPCGEKREIFVRDAGGVTIPAAKIEKSLGRDLDPPQIPTRLKISKIAGRALRPLRTVCIIGICLGIFSAELGSGIGHFSQVNHKMITASLAGSRGEVKGGVGPRARLVWSGMALKDASAPHPIPNVKRQSSVLDTALANR